MTLQSRKRFIDGVRFRNCLTNTIFLFQVALIGFVSGHASPTFDLLFPGKWFHQVEFRDRSSSKCNELGVCNVVRGGDLDSNESEVSSTMLLDNPALSIKVSTSPYSFNLFQEKDGSEADPDGIPRRFLRMQNDKRDQAKKAVEATLKWREENDIDTILARPHSKFDVCKKIFPQYFCGRDDDNHIILLQRPGLIDLSMAMDNGLSGEDLLYRKLGLHWFDPSDGTTCSYLLFFDAKTTYMPWSIYGRY